jgi:hypothetical protein
VTSRQGPAAAEEQAELQALRDRAVTSGREVGDTVAALAARVAAAGTPQAWAHRKAAEARSRAWQAACRTAARPLAAGWPKLAAWAGIPAGVIVLVAMWQHRRHS